MIAALPNLSAEELIFLALAGFLLLALFRKLFWPLFFGGLVLFLAPEYFGVLVLLGLGFFALRFLAFRPARGR